MSALCPARLLARRTSSVYYSNAWTDMPPEYVGTPTKSAPRLATANNACLRRPTAQGPLRPLASLWIPAREAVGHRLPRTGQLFAQRQRGAAQPKKQQACAADQQGRWNAGKD